MSYVRKLGASALVVAAAFAVAFAVLVSSTSNDTAEAATVQLPEANPAATAAPGDTVEIAVNGTLAQLSITGTGEGVGASFVANDGQSISCANENSCDKDTTPATTETVTVQLKVDADSGEGYILVSVVGLGASTVTAQTTKVITVSKETLVGSLAIKAVAKTIAADDDDTTVGNGGPNETNITVNVKNASANTEGMNGQSVTLITTLGTISCDGTNYAQACSVTTADSSSTPGVDDGEAGWATVTLVGGGVEGVATITATLSGLTDTAAVTMFGSAKNLAAEPQQGSIEIGGNTYVVLTVTDGAGNPVSNLVITPITDRAKEVVGPADDAVDVVTERDTAEEAGVSAAGVGYSKDFIHATDSTKSIPACGDDNTGSSDGTTDDAFGPGTDDNGQCVVHVRAPEKADGDAKDATRGVHTLNFEVSATVKASTTIEVAGKPNSISTNAPASVETASVTEITVSVFDDEDVLVGITSVKVRKVGGDGLIEDQGDGGSEMTANGQSKFTFIAPSTAGTSEILITAGDVDHRVSLQIGEAAPEPEPEPEPAPALSTTPSSTGHTLVTFNGGSVDELGTVLTDACGAGVRAYATDYQGDWVTFIPSAPALVNGPFNALFADGIPAGTPLLVGSCGG